MLVLDEPEHRAVRGLHPCPGHPAGWPNYSNAAKDSCHGDGVALPGNGLGPARSGWRPLFVHLGQPMDGGFKSEVQRTVSH